MNLCGQSEIVFQGTLLLRRQTAKANRNQWIVHEPVGFDAVVTYGALAKVSGVDALNRSVNFGDEFRHLLTGLVLEKMLQPLQASFQLLARCLKIRRFCGRHVATYVLRYV